MGAVHHHAHPAALGDDQLAEGRQAAVVPVEAAVADQVGGIVRRQEHAQPQAVEGLDAVELVLDEIAPLGGHQQGSLALVVGPHDVVCGLDQQQVVVAAGLISGTT